ncbi:MAG TPA: nucleoside-diphosphate kinase [Armatimonadota bacterium]
MVKPDGVRRGLSGEILARFERKGFKVIGLKKMMVPEPLALEHYAVHMDKPFFGELVEFITSGPVVAMVLEAPDAIKVARLVIGATRPTEAVPGTIRGDLAIETQQNLVHGSDAPETAQAEIALWFKPEELLG